MTRGKTTALTLLLAGLGLSFAIYSLYVLGSKNQPKAPSIFTLIDRARDTYSGEVYARFEQKQKDGRFNIYQPDIVPIKVGNNEFFSGPVKYLARPPAEHLEFLSGGLESLAFIKPSVLETCPRLTYFDHRAALESESVFYSRVDPDIDPVEALRLRDRDMEYWASTYLGQAIDYAGLEQIAADEIALIGRDYQNLRTELKVNSLDDYAQDPSHFTEDTDAYRDQFKIEMARARSSTAKHFYDYDLGRARPFIIGECHPYKAYASYHTYGRIQIYDCAENRFDTKRTLFLAAHEFYPGHHLHFDTYKALRMCTDEKRPSVGFSEGIATYGEYLSAEEKFSDPAQKLGWLDYRQIRAGRIIMDIARLRDGVDNDGLRALWTANTPPRLHGNFDEELHRLKNSRQFQHLKYMLGHMAITQVKAQLETELGEGFDEKRFHHALLTTPLKHGPYLYDQVKAAMELDISDFLSELAGEIPEAANN